MVEENRSTRQEEAHLRGLFHRMRERERKERERKTIWFSLPGSMALKTHTHTLLIFFH